MAVFLTLSGDLDVTQWCWRERREGESFAVRGLTVRVEPLPGQPWGAGAWTGRVRQFADELERVTGIELVHSNDAHYRAKRFSLRSSTCQEINRAIDRLMPAYSSSWTRYYDSRDLDRLAESRGDVCDWCGEPYDRKRTNTWEAWDFDDELRIERILQPMDGWIVFRRSDSVFCTRLCLDAWTNERVKKWRREQMEEKWLRKARRSLKETRRWLKDRKGHAAPASPLAESEQDTTSPT